MTSFSTGLTVLMRSRAWQDPMTMWTEYPHTHVTAATKLYYLMQLAFWVHMLFVTIIEVRARAPALVRARYPHAALQDWRKDFAMYMMVRSRARAPAVAAWPSLTPLAPPRTQPQHHVATIALVGTSWFTHYTSFGTATLVALDMADIFLPLAKALRYAKRESLGTVVFALFVGTLPLPPPAAPCALRLRRALTRGWQWCGFPPAMAPFCGCSTPATLTLCAWSPLAGIPRAGPTTPRRSSGRGWWSCWACSC